ncbi:MAG: hypothetical protein HC910_09595 [Spirulinaceae cyanobacterium SM2_1_0]|nr:hypothetical protein [Spirulinaceae cyanobacterium SM2_1_0]
MANYSAIAIGINRYQFIQPLSYAQADAQALHSFLIEEAELPKSQALLLSDASPWLDNQSTYPTGESIRRWLQPPDAPTPKPFLWFFFSGYAAHVDGQDYFMPIDANPADILSTGIAASEILDLLAQHGAENIVLCLDINRSPNAIAGANVGAEIVQLAQDQGFICILSCQLEETSHESMALGHGMFAVALLEVLRYYRHEVTLDRLARYLCDRLPELSQHHWRPVQNPLILMPSLELVDRSLLPVAMPESQDTPAVVETPSPVVELTADQESTHSNGNNRGSATALDDPGNGHSGSTSLQLPTFNNPSGEAEPPELTGGVEDIREDIAPPIPSEPPESSSSRGRWLLWSGLALALLLLAGWLGSRRQTALVETPDPPVVAPAPDAATESPVAPDAAAPAPDTTASPAPDPATLAPETAVSPAVEDGAAPAPETAASPAPDAAAPGTGVDQGVTSPTTPAPETAASPSPDAQIAAPPATTAPALAAQTPAAVTQTEGASRAILARARTYIQANQATGFSRAVAEARKIPAGAPLYDEAQADIQRWSQVILDIGKGRAARGQFGAAIAAAQLVSPDRGELYQDAQASVARWQQQAQQQTVNLKVLSDARRTINYTQASSYNQAITMLAAIPPGQPGYLEAESLRERWSRQIYLIANSRAAQGNLEQAIATARLVPTGTSNYTDAQQAIARWQQ